MSKSSVTTHKRLRLDEERFETLRNHILDPQQFPLQTREEEQQLRRVQQAAMLIQEYPNEAHVITLMLQSHRITRTQARRDIAIAKEMFKTDFNFDWDFWRAWQIKDQLELIREAKLKGDLREWNNAKKLLHELIGAKPEAIEDPRRMEKNVFFIQIINADGKRIQVPLDKFRFSGEDVATLIDTFNEPISDAQAEEIMNS
ncbi:MAG: hypothetical protein IJQ44_08220 [Bacteroidaceae bacterium]|nr:hypothetical protein [Bacteroidaceae bacterium]